MFLFELCAIAVVMTPPMPNSIQFLYSSGFSSVVAAVGVSPSPCHRHELTAGKSYSAIRHERNREMSHHNFDISI